MTTEPKYTGAAADHEPIHAWFGLTYSAYLVLHRVALQEMPVEWQRRFVTLLQEMERTIDCKKMPSQFDVRAKDPENKGRYFSDPYTDYRRGRAPLRKDRK